MFDLFYKKNKNEKLFAYLEDSGFKCTQNYIPLFSKFFHHAYFIKVIFG